MRRVKEWSTTKDCCCLVLVGRGSGRVCVWIRLGGVPQDPLIISLRYWWQDLQASPTKSYERSPAPTQVSARRPTPTTTDATAANAAAAYLTPRHPPPYPMKTAAHDDPPPSLPLGPLLGTLPAHLLQQEVLRRLGPTDLASLAGAGRGCAAAVVVTALMQWATCAKRTAPCEFFQRLQNACSHAACGGNREVLEWLHNTGCPLDAKTCRMAARGGHLEVLQWARVHGCPWDFGTCMYAARFGHLHVLQWAREHHCPWNSRTCC